MEYSDIQVIERVLRGEVALFEILIRRNNALLYKTGRSCNYNHQDTQDLMQETFVDAYRSLSKFENRSAFKTWIVRIMLNNCFRKRMKSSFKNEVADDIDDKSTPIFQSDKSNDTDNMVMNGELRYVIEKALHRIPLDYRLVFSMREINGLNVKETADALGITEANVKVRLNRAKKMLQHEVAKSYTAEEIFEFNLVYCDAMVERVLTRINDLHAS